MPDRKFLRIILLIGLMLAILFFGSKVFISYKIKKALNETPQLRYERLSVRLLSRSVEFDSISYCGNETQGIEFKSSGVRMSGLEIWPWLTGKGIRFRTCEINDPDVWYFKMSAREDSASADSEAFRTPVEINRFNIKNGSFTMLMDDNKWLVSEGVHVNMDELKRDSSGKMQWSNLILESEHFSYIPFNDLHYTTIRKFIIQEADSTVQITGLRVKCHYPVDQFYKHVVRKTSRSDLEVNSLLLEQADVRSFINENAIKIGMIRCDTATFFGYDDGRIPVCTQCYKELPNEVLQKLALDVRLDSILIGHADFKYAFRSKLDPNLGEITFRNSRIVASGFCNIDSSLEKSHKAEIHVVTTFMNEARMEARFDIPQISPNALIYWSGKIESFPLATLDECMFLNDKLWIKGGMCESLEFQCWGNINTFGGDVAFAYSDLKFDIVNEKHKTQPIPTALARLFLTSKHHREGDGNFTPASVEIDRDPNRSIFYHLAYTIMKGISKTVTP